MMSACHPVSVVGVAFNAHILLTCFVVKATGLVF